MWKVSELMPHSHFRANMDLNPIIGIAILIIGLANLIFEVWGLIGIFRLFRNIWSYL